MRTFRNRQQGVVLLVALTVLVAMSLAGVALIRSVDTAALVSGNIAFRSAGVQVADRGVQEALGWLMQTRKFNPTQLYNDVSAQGYYSSRVLPEPDWYDDQTWQGALPINGGMTDASGNQIYYIIHRMCTVPNAAPQANVGSTINDCPQFYPSALGSTLTGQSYAIGSPRYNSLPQNYYRITTRVVGPRNNITITQTTILM